MKQDPQDYMPEIIEYRIELPIGVQLTPDTIQAIQNLDDHGFYSIDRTEKGIDIYIAWDGEESHLHSEVSKLFEDFELVRVHQNEM